jgi:multicomponent Na+:H+ antiporter subunit G
MSEIIAAIFFITGSFFMFLAGLGVWRFPDLFSRMHAATKAASFGIGLMLAGLMIIYFSWYWLIFSSLTILFVFITAPVAAHMLGRAAYFQKVAQYEGTIADELAHDLQKKQKNENHQRA